MRSPLFLLGGNVVKNLFLAKSNPKETIREHTENLLSELMRMKETYPEISFLSWRLLEYACKYHDVGKVNSKFQNKILKAIKIDDSLNDCLPKVNEVPHGYLSCAFIPFNQLESLEEKKIVAQAVFFHHNRPKSENRDLADMIQKDLLQYYKDFKGHLPFSIEEPKFNFSRYISKRISKETDSELLNSFIMVKGLLNKIDHAASAGIPVEIANAGLTSYLDQYFTNTLKSERNELQEYMKAHEDCNNIIIASTGIGKTEGALYWIGDHKGFFTLPLRVSINSIYERVYKMIKFQDVALLHSETEREYIALNNFSLDYFERTKQWSMPLTICTLDQILDFVFKQEGYEKKLATLAYSKLIIDEIQMYSPKMLACLLYALKEITDIGGKFTIMTATFAPFIEDLMSYLNIETNKPDKPFLKKKNGKSMIRHRLLAMNQQLTSHEIKNNRCDKKILVIVNTVAKAQNLYEELKKTRKDVYLFHGRFTRTDKQGKEDAIIKMGQPINKEQGIWITTQVVEASVDIDFDVLYTELSDLNGLFQRMGRVYRGRSLDHDRVNIYVFLGGDDYPSGINEIDDKSIIDKSIFNFSKQSLMSYSEPIIFTEEMKMDLIETTYTTESLQDSTYYQEIKSFLDLLNNIVEYDQLDDRITDLREIFNQTVIPKSEYKKNEDIINGIINDYKNSFNIKNREAARIARGKLRDKLLGFTVDIPQYRVKMAKNLNRDEGQIGLGSHLFIPVIDYKYDRTIGLQYTNEKKLFDADQFS